MPSAAPGRIFISYRREETAYPAGWLFDRLSARFGDGQVFKDVDSIQLGDDFVDVMTTAVGSCDVLLALIGDQWVTITDESGRRRLDDPNDFVRLEVEAALSRKVRVIPVLVDGATMPEAEHLPPSLAPLTRRQALELSPSRFDFDLSRLLKVLDRTLAEVHGPPEPPERPRPAGPASPPGTRRRPLSRRTKVLVGLGAGVVALVPVLILTLSSGSGSGGPSRSKPAQGTVVFRDDFSSKAYGWNDTTGTANGGRYANGTYRMHTAWTADHWSDQAFPHEADRVFPAAPRDVGVSVVARRLREAKLAAYGVACRANEGGQSYYQFAVWPDHVAIEKLIPYAPYYFQLGAGDWNRAAVRPNGWNRLQALCTTDAARHVHLAFRVNGKVVASGIDRNRPLLAGTVGLLVATGQGAKTIDAEFDDFLVRQL